MRQARAAQIGWVVGLLVLALIGRLFQLQVLQGQQWSDEARLSRLEVRTLPFRRGRILDRAGRVLAEDRITHELHCNYREFRRGHPAGQLLEALGLMGIWHGGLDAVLADAEVLGEVVFGWTAEQLQRLPSRDRQDLCFYVRGLAGMNAPGVATEVLAWAHGGSGSFEQNFPGAQAGFERRVAAARLAMLQLEERLGPEWRGALLPVIEEERAQLERRIRALAVAEALGNALPEPGAGAARELLAAGGAEGEALLDTLRARWGEALDPDWLRAVLTGTLSDPEEADAARVGLLQHIARAVPADVDGLRRRLVMRVHNDRVIRLVRDLAYEPADLVVQRAVDYPGLFVQEVPDRVYPIDVAPHLVGRVGAMGESELEEYRRAREEFQVLSRDFYRSEADERRYQELRHFFLARVQHPDEASGASGIERAFEVVLRGERGYIQLVQGGEEGERPQELVFEAPRDGRDVVLSLDVELQRAAEDALREAYAMALDELDPRDERFRDDPARLAATRAALREPRAAMVILDLRDGGLPVLATLPTYTRDEFRYDYARLQADRTNAPLRQRALGGMPDGPQVPYPGSTFKLLVAALALQEDPDWWTRPLVCEGRLEVPGGSVPLRCEGWHGSIEMDKALRKSCNIYFYKLAERLGYERVHDYAAQLGFGRPTGIELVPAERSADGEWVPGGPDAALELGANGLMPAERYSQRDTMRLGIGQTRVWASPLQIARFFGWLATGTLLSPRLVAEGAGASPAAPPERAPRLLAADRQHLEKAMREVVAHLEGTAYDPARPLHDLEGTVYDPARPPRLFDVAGKTGTAQVGGDGLTHAWFAGYFPADQPRYAFAVYCENAGLHGGEIASDALYFLLTDGKEEGRENRAAPLLPPQTREQAVPAGG